MHTDSRLRLVLASVFDFVVDVSRGRCTSPKHQKAIRKASRVLTAVGYGGCGGDSGDVL